MGEDETGFIMYHPEGYMLAQMMSPGRPKKYVSGGSAYWNERGNGNCS